MAEAEGTFAQRDPSALTHVSDECRPAIVLSFSLVRMPDVPNVVDYVSAGSVLPGDLPQANEGCCGVAGVCSNPASASCCKCLLSQKNGILEHQLCDPPSGGSEKKAVEAVEHAAMRRNQPTEVLHPVKPFEPRGEKVAG